MRFNVLSVIPFVVGIVLTPLATGSVIAPPFLEPSFEGIPISNGSYGSGVGPWNLFQNSFVVDPIISPVYDGANNTRAATYTPQHGEQYVSTYAGNGGLDQFLTFDQPGIFRVSAYAASPSGSLFIQTPVTSGTFPLVSGQFRFRVGNTLFGETYETPAGGAWRQFSSLLTIESSGTYRVGAKNTKSAVYFNYYDNFNIEYVGAVPEPATIILGGVSLVCGVVSQRGRRRS